MIEERTNLHIVKYPLSFEIWIFHNGQPDRDDDLKIFVATTSTDIDSVYLCCPYNVMSYKILLPKIMRSDYPEWRSLRSNKPFTCISPLAVFSIFDDLMCDSSFC